MSVLHDLEAELQRTGDMSVAQVLHDLYIESALPPTALEREWKRWRAPELARLLKQVYAARGLDPAREFERLDREVNREVWKDQLEEITGEHGNFEREPWAVQVLKDVPTYGPRRGDPLPKPDYVVPRTTNWSGELWVDRETTRFPVLEYAPGYLQRDLEREYGRDAEFVTTFLDGATDADYFRDPKTGAVYQRVATDSWGERECPLQHVDRETGQWDDQLTRPVDLEDTELGARPGEACRLCDELVGAEHGFLPYDVVGSVYVRLRPRNATVETPEARAEVERQWLEAYEGDYDRYELRFERGGQYRDSAWVVYGYTEGVERPDRFRAEDDGEGGVDFT